MLHLLYLVRNVGLLGPKDQLRVPIDHQEARDVVKVAGCDPVHSHSHLYSLVHIKGAEERRGDLFSTVVERQTDRCEARALGLGTDLNLGHEPIVNSFCGSLAQEGARYHPLEGVIVRRTERSVVEIGLGS